MNTSRRWTISRRRGGTCGRWGKRLARRMAARGLRHVRVDDDRHRPGLREVRDACAGLRDQQAPPRAGARPPPTCSSSPVRTIARASAGSIAAAAGCGRGGRRGATGGGSAGRAQAGRRPFVKERLHKTPRNRSVSCGSARSSSSATAPLTGACGTRPCVTSPTTSRDLRAPLRQGPRSYLRIEDAATRRPRSSRPRWLEARPLGRPGAHAKKLNGDSPHP